MEALDVTDSPYTEVLDVTQLHIWKGGRAAVQIWKRVKRVRGTGREGGREGVKRARGRGRGCSRAAAAAALTETQGLEVVLGVGDRCTVTKAI